ncbi:hypothetical protein BGW38_003559 [Lunasporangiospora selenospora]|uniref:Major facilitator superfamily (MFS) profile domain-containing protein n=1 Tax=Lunasporangiospora selenospora TaxID=979761 RepID=A0A9P6KCS0_9FUNG|nr:hypothetical protein BGW38_003559 [Lunasporangiospora selenospora]
MANNPEASQSSSSITEKVYDGPDPIVSVPAANPLGSSTVPAELTEQDPQDNNTLCHAALDNTPAEVGHAADYDNRLDQEEPYGWVVVAAAFCVQAMTIGTVNGYGVYQDRYIKHEYSNSTTFQLAWVGTLNVVGMDLVGPFTGQFADYYGYRLSTFIGALIMGAALVATSFSTQVWQLYLFQGLGYGIGGSLAFFPSIALPSQWFNKRRGFATGITVAGGGVGGLIMSPLSTALFNSIGYQWTVRVTALIHLVVLIPVAYLFRSRIESGRGRKLRKKLEDADRELKIATNNNTSNLHSDEKTDESSERGLEVQPLEKEPPRQKLLDFSVLKDRKFFVLVCIGFFTTMGYFNPYYYLPTYVRNRGISTETGALLVGLLNGASAIGRVSMGIASDHIGDINTLFISTLLSSLSVLLIWMFAGSSVAVIAIFCFVYGFFSGSFIAVLPTVAAHLCGIERLASVTGIVYFGVAAGTLVGSPAGGAILDVSQGLNYRPLQIWVGLVMGVGAILSIVLKFWVNPSIKGRV